MPICNFLNNGQINNHSQNKKKMLQYGYRFVDFSELIPNIYDIDGY